MLFSRNILELSCKNNRSFKQKCSAAENDVVWFEKINQEREKKLPAQKEGKEYVR